MPRLSGDAHDDTTHTTLTNKIIRWTATRNSIAGQMRAILVGAAFNGQKFDENLEKQLIALRHPLARWPPSDRCRQPDPPPCAENRPGAGG